MTLILVAVITACIGIMVLFRNAPKAIDLAFNPPERTLIYSSDGILLARFSTQNRQQVPISQIPLNLQHATVAFEDKRFYSHSGVDFQGIGRALIRNFKSGDLKGQGASTITQQLARNLGVGGLTREKTFQRKFHELIVANQIEKSYPKQRILEMYLNVINYGSSAYGVQAAAQTYFGKNVQNLDLAQCALLAGLPNRPAYYNPYHDKAAAQAQRNLVLQTMLDQHFITPVQYAAAVAKPVRLAFPKAPMQGSQIMHAPYFVNYVVDQLKRKYGDDRIDQGNLKVYTTLNWQMQQSAEKALRDGIARVQGRGPNQGCLVAIDQKTGEIKAMVGGMDYAKNEFNEVTQGRRQPGSTFKAVVYSAAIDSGLVTENTRVEDQRTVYHLSGGPWIPKDDSGYSNRDYTLRQAMAYSVNVIAVRVLQEIGPQTAIRYARVMGVDSDLSPVLSLALGSSAVTPLEMAQVYGTIAAGGDHAEPIAFTLLTDLNGKTIENIPPSVETRVLSRNTAQQVDDMLRAVVTDPYGTGISVSGISEARGKTGTTQGHQDVWFDGYVPGALTCVVWAGHPYKNPKTGQDEYGETMAGDAWGSTVCAPIWREFMQTAVPLFLSSKAKYNTKPAAKTSLSATKTTEDAVLQSAEAGTNSSAPAGIAPEKSQTPTQTTPTKQQKADTSTTSNGTQTADATNITSPDTATVKQNDPLTAVASANTPPPASPLAGSTAHPEANVPPVTIPSSPVAIPSPPRIHLPAAPALRKNPPPVHVSPPRSTPSSTTLPEFKPPPHPRRTHVPEFVTVKVNPADGLLATKWTPQYIFKTYPKGQEPHRYTKMYHPPPGEH